MTRSRLLPRSQRERERAKEKLRKLRGKRAQRLATFGNHFKVVCENLSGGIKVRVVG